MTKLKEFATNHPLSFSLLTILAYFLLGALFAGLVAVVLGTEYFDPLPQSIGSLAAVGAILLVAWRFATLIGWSKALSRLREARRSAASVDSSLKWVAWSKYRGRL